MARKPRHHRLQVADRRPEMQRPPAVDDIHFPALAPNSRAGNKIEWCAPFRVMDLPAEIRLLIWELLIPDHTPGLHWLHGCVGDYPKHPWFLPKICRTSQQIKNDIAQIAVRDYKFVIHYEQEESYLPKFLSSVPRGYEAVRKLHLAYFDVYTDDQGDKLRAHGAKVPREVALDLALSSSNLTAITLEFGARYTAGRNRFDFHSPLRRLQDIKQIIRKYRLHQLLQCENIREIHFQHQWQEDREAVIMKEVENWLVKRLSLKRPDQKVRSTNGDLG